MKIARSPFESLALAVGAVGWAWGVIVILATVLTLERDGGAPYPAGQLGEAFAGVKPVYRELLSPTGIRLQGHGTCSDMWFDDDAVLIRGIGPMNGSTAPAWLTLTVAGRVFAGRVTVDLWNGVGAGTGGLESSTDFIVATNLRFVERVPPPRPGPPGWRVISPGECVLGSTEPQDASGVIGRFLIDLPGQRSLNIGLLGELVGDFVPLEASLALDGKSPPKVFEGEFKGDHYHTERDGRYELTVRRTDSPDGGRATGGHWRRYTVQVAWGASIWGSCEPPSKYDHNCFEEVPP
jgi:hypothetical protein